MKRLFTLLLFFGTTLAFAQAQKAKDKVLLTMDSAIQLSDAGQYAEADVKFLYVLKHIRSVPSDLTYHFGKNSFYLGKYRQSIDWLNKYIQLKGTKGEYSNEAMGWLSKAETELLKQKEKEAKHAAEVLSGDYYIDCGPTGKVVCPTCKGTAVVVRKNYFGEVYKACPSCNKLGYLTCDDYNKLLKGKLITEN
jgi:hypothetical protein